MCGRYAIYAAPHRLIELFGAEIIPNFPARYNAAPLQDLPIIVKNRIGLARWGLLPPWVERDDKGLCAKMINARSETVSEKPAFREGWERGRRCLIPANGFYEWKGAGDAKQAYYLHHKTADVICFAGLWAKKDDLVTFTVLTKDADAAIADIHHRMPVIFTSEQAKDWFAADERGAFDMIRQAAGRDMVFRPVGRDVGKVANDHEGLMAETLTNSSQTALLV
jgi:putative SOS response-associated peptidase YedK